MITIDNFEGGLFDSEEILQTYSKDASIFAMKPKLVATPKNVHDIEQLITFITEKRKEGDTTMSLTARSAGTDMSGGPLTNSIVVSCTENFNTIGDIVLGNNPTISFAPGAYYRDLEKKTLEKGLIFPSYPASKALCAMGGIINNNSGGEKTLSYGKTLDYVEEITMVCSDGHTYTFKEFAGDELKKILEEDTTFFGDVHRGILKLVQENKEEIAKAKPTVSKNSAGYYLWEVWNEEKGSLNLAKLICGAQGTLGIMSEAKLRLVPVKPFVHTVVTFIGSVSDIPAVVEKTLPFKPESFELYDDHTFKIAVKFLPDIAKRMGGSMLSLGIQFIPEMWMALTGGVPKIVLIAEFTGENQEEVDARGMEAYKAITSLREAHKGVHVRNIKTPTEAKKYWTFRRESFNLLRSKLSGLRTAPFIEDVVIHSTDFPTFFPEFEKLLDSYGLIYTIAGHVGDGNLHVIPLMKLSEEKNIDTIKELSEKVYALVQKYNGSITGEHNDGLVRTPFLHYMFSEKMLELFKRAKHIFDPEMIFNPHKKVGVTWEEATAQIDRSI